MAPDSIPPDCAHRFRPLELLGEGGFGRVYLAEQIGLDRRVAIKVLRSDILLDESQRRRFVEEGRITARLSHANVVRVIDAGAGCGCPWVVYELVEGPSVREMVNKEPLDWRAAVAIGTSVAAALDEAHRHGIVHRDVKAENVLRSSDGQYKLADFGIAKWGMESAVKTGTGFILGTPSHMAPELIQGKEPSPPSDVYALGVLLYELFTGRQPFDGANLGALLKSHLSEHVQTPSRLQPDMPHELDSILAGALEKDPDKRTPSARALGEALEQVLAAAEAPRPAPARLRGAAGTGLGPRDPGRTVVVRQSALAREGSRRAYLAAGAVLCLCVIMGMAGFRKPGPLVPSPVTGEVLVATARAPLPPGITGDLSGAELTRLYGLSSELVHALVKHQGRGPITQDLFDPRGPCGPARELVGATHRQLQKYIDIVRSRSHERKSGPGWLLMAHPLRSFRYCVLAVHGICRDEVVGELKKLDPLAIETADVHRACFAAMARGELRLMRGERSDRVLVSRAYASALEALLKCPRGEGDDRITFYQTSLTLVSTYLMAKIDERGAPEPQVSRDLLAIAREMEESLERPEGPSIADGVVAQVLVTVEQLRLCLTSRAISSDDMRQVVRMALAVVERTTPYEREAFGQSFEKACGVAKELGIDTKSARAHLERLRHGRPAEAVPERRGARQSGSR